MPSNRMDRFAEPAFVLLAATYWLSLFLPRWPGAPLHKATPMLLAAWVLLRALPARTGMPLALGFAAAAAGDAFLAVDRQAWLVQALLCFLVTHLAYIAAFSRDAAPLTERALPRLAVLVFAALMLAWMWPGLGDLRTAVSLYVVALAAMAVTAAGAGPRPGRLFLGAALFVIADAMIGVDRFVSPLPHAEKIIVATYATGQFLIFIGALRLWRRHPTHGDTA